MKAMGFLVILFRKSTSALWVRTRVTLPACARILAWGSTANAERAGSMQIRPEKRRAAPATSVARL